MEDPKIKPNEEDLQAEDDVLDAEFALEDSALEFPEPLPSMKSKKKESSAETSSLIPSTALNRYLAEVRRYPFLSKEEEIELFQEYRVQGSREAAVKLILANLRLSVAIASECCLVGQSLYITISPEFTPPGQNWNHTRTEKAVLQFKERKGQTGTVGLCP